MGSYQRERAAAVTEPSLAVGPSRHHRPHVDVAREPPVEQARQVSVPRRAVGAPEKRRVDRKASAVRRRHLRPARLRGVPRLDAEDPGIGGEQVVPGVERVARDLRHALPDDSPTAAASGLTVTTASRRACSSVSSTVISFVRLAIGTLVRASCASSTSPVAPFSTSQARPLTCGAAPSAGTASTSAATAATTTALTGRRFYSADADALADPQV